MNKLYVQKTKILVKYNLSYRPYLDSVFKNIFRINLVRLTVSKKNLYERFKSSNFLNLNLCLLATFFFNFYTDLCRQKKIEFVYFDRKIKVSKQNIYNV